MTISKSDRFLIKLLPKKQGSRLCTSSYKLLKYVETGQVKLNDIITRKLSLDDVAKGYEIFHKKEDSCVKLVLDTWK